MKLETQKPEAELNLAELAAMLEKATLGPWRIDRGGSTLSENVWITAYEREGFKREFNPICSVSTKRRHYAADKDAYGNRRGESRSWETPIIKAEDDAKLIVAAVNALPELLRRIGYDGSESAWLIEWPADDYGPIRYWAAGKPKPVIDVNKATRFSRKEDAETVMRQFAEKGASAHEHMWMPSKREKVAA